ncbi:Hypothetical protein SRAE_2000498900 [Strongyloides ratti]|uniref:Uncharacterized protein n=1 Tax=Strongyloides ratti TaxID=34506 RepID=A0A090LRZ1_STRRB|nr:Hypothetical protein SRAE_2000498900 [Strongyloides ratti]CEF70356.1 Hypothetical protein SRAE_2000498900 [Strongyloides ratti]
MKYLIPLYFILFLSIITIINVFSSSIQSTTTKPVNGTRYRWRPLNKPLNGTFITKLGKEAVDFFNTKHPKKALTYVNVTSAQKRGKKENGNKQIKLKILVSRISSNEANAQLLCHHLRAIFNVSTEGKKTIVKERQIGLKTKFDCYKKNNTSSNAIKQPNNKDNNIPE